MAAPDYVLKLGDAREVLAKLKPATIDALVCDPPAGISFMSKDWDAPTGVAGVEAEIIAGDDRGRFIHGMRAIFTLCLRAMKPGAHGLVWALPRTSHWTATALEDAGFEIRDIVMHLFGTGFPKSLNVAKALQAYDAAIGPPTGPRPSYAGWGTALKPAAEHWILIRKPLEGTVAANVLKYGTGGLNIDGCRIGSGAGGTREGEASAGVRYADRGATNFAATPGPRGGDAAGRWPAHLALDEEAAAQLDVQSGETGAAAPVRGDEPSNPVEVGGVLNPRKRVPGAFHADRGGASRFFYVSKASRSEREAGCEDLPVRSGGEATGREDGSAGLNSPRAGAGRTGGARNHHPTVKSIALMRWLCRLITPPRGFILDPFLGSGSTGCAAILEGFRFIGIEREEDYIEIAKRRIAHAAKQVTDGEEAA